MSAHNCKTCIEIPTFNFNRDRKYGQITCFFGSSTNRAIGTMCQGFQRNTAREKEKGKNFKTGCVKNFMKLFNPCKRHDIYLFKCTIPVQQEAVKEHVTTNLSVTKFAQYFDVAISNNSGEKLLVN